MEINNNHHRLRGKECYPPPKLGEGWGGGQWGKAIVQTFICHLIYPQIPSQNLTFTIKPHLKPQKFKNQ